IMQQYGVSKPVFLNETGFMCAETVAGEPAEWCVPPGDAFFEMQADFAVRTFVRGMSEDVMGFIWYTLNGPGWRHTGMFNSDQTPRPVYTAYQTLNNQLKGTTYAAPAEHGIWVEGYIFTSRTRLVQVLWSRNDATHVVSIPAETFIAAYDRENNPITPTLSGNYYQLQVQFAPIYVLLHP
ncbi:MAG: hypothetical protein GY796_24520, partial [Chloroflexi bacterium]|nr:hypothetical protein [Chloroflexota bacterium]